MKYTFKIIVTKEYLTKISEKLECSFPDTTSAIALIKTTWGDFRVEFYLPVAGIIDADATIDVFTQNPVESLEYALDKIVKQKPLKIL